MATVAAPQYVSQPVKTTMFMSRRSDLRAVKVPVYPRYGPSGQKVGDVPGQAVQFINGRLDVPEKGKMVLADGRQADAGEIREWLMAHPMHGSIQEGFWVVDQTAPPVSEEEMDLLLRSSLDEDVLLEVIAQEERGWARDALLRPARAQLERVLEMKAQMEAEQAERTEEERQRVAEEEKARKDAAKAAKAKPE